MATYYSDKGGLRYSPRNRPEGALIADPFSLTISATVVNSDVFVLNRIPAGSTVIGFTIDLPAVDSHATPLATVGVGDSGSSTRFLNTAVLPNTGVYRLTSFVSPTAISNLIDGADTATLPRAYTTPDDFRITVTTAPNTGVSSGTIKGTLFYTMEPFYSDPKL